jgi:hypothetical protein
MALQHLRSSTADKRPTPAAMSDGQLALNTNLASPGLFFKDSNGDSVKIGPVHVGTTAPNVSPAVGGEAGNSLGEAWLDTTAANPILKVFNGSAFVAVQPVGTGTVVSTTDTGTVTSTMILDGTILNADINASAAIAGTKISPDFGSQTVTTTGVISSALGAEATPSITFTGDLNTGIYSPGADQVAVATNGTGRLFIDATGNVGVGATANANGVLRLNVASGNNANLVFSENNTDRYILGQVTGDNALRVYDIVAASERLRITSTGQLSHIGGGSSGSPAVGFNGSAPSNSLVVDSLGKVGIGTSSPSKKLHVSAASGDVDALVECPGHPILRLKTTGTTDNTSVDFADSGSDTQCRLIYTHSTDLFRIVHSGNNALSIDSSGRVGIGTTSPALKLHVEDSGSQVVRWTRTGVGAGSLDVDASGNAVVNAHTSSTGIAFHLQASEKARLDSSGRFLVGTASSSSDSVIVVQGYAGVSAGAGEISITRGGTPSTADQGLGTIKFQNNNNNTGAQIDAFSEGSWTGGSNHRSRLTFSTTPDSGSSPVERLRIDSAGRCKVTGGILRVDPSDAANGAYLDFASDQLQVGNDSAGSINYVYLAAGGTSWTASSDERQKTDLVPIDDGLNKVGSLRAVTGRYLSDDDGTSRSFLIAQDVQSVLPEAVDASNPDSLGVSYTDVIPLLVAALKESKDRIESLEAKVAALETP